MSYGLLVCCIAEHVDLLVHSAQDKTTTTKSSLLHSSPCIEEMVGLYVSYCLGCPPCLFSRRAASLVHNLNGSYEVPHNHKRLNGGGTGSNRTWTSYTRLFDTMEIGGGVGGLALAARNNHSGDGDDVGLENNEKKIYNTVLVLGGPGSGKGTQVNCWCCRHLYCTITPCLKLVPLFRAWATLLSCYSCHLLLLTLTI